jgi:hypothetical protein
MKITPAGIEKILKVLEQTSRRISDATIHIDEERLYARLDKRSWSAKDILAHLRSCGDVWGDSIQSMLAEDHPKLPDLHPGQWIKQTNYAELEFHKSLKAYINQRRELLGALKTLSFEDWSRGAIIGGRKHTVFSQVRRMGKHETEHCEQLESLLK